MIDGQDYLRTISKVVLSYALNQNSLARFRAPEVDVVRQSSADGKQFALTAVASFSLGKVFYY